MRINYFRLVKLPLIIFILAACPARPPVTDCEPGASRCAPSGMPEICSPSQRWQPTGPEGCPEDTQCCLTTSSQGGTIHACSAAARCVEEN